MKQLICFEGSEWLIEREAFTWCEHKGGWPVTSRAMICPWCCSIYAKLLVENHSGFSFEGVSCEACARPTDRHPVPGSLLDSSMTSVIDWSLVNHLPEPLLRREFELTLKAFQ